MYCDKKKIKVKKTIFVTQRKEEKNFKVVFLRNSKWDITINLATFSIADRKLRNLLARKCQIINDGICFQGNVCSKLTKEFSQPRTNLLNAVDDNLLIFHLCDRQNMCFVVIYWRRLSELHWLLIVITTRIYEFSSEFHQHQTSKESTREIKFVTFCYQRQSCNLLHAHSTRMLSSRVDFRLMRRICT